MQHFTLVLVAILALSVNCYKMKKSCPDLMPYANFSINHILGTSYLKFAYFSNGANLNNTKCFKDTFTLQNNLIITNGQYLNENGTVINSGDQIQIDPMTAGAFTSQEEVTVYGFFGYPHKKNATRNYTVLYSDPNIYIVYSCLEIENFWWTEADYFYLVNVRNRGFDSINQFMPVIKAIQAIPENLNEIQFINNSPACTN